MSVAFTSAAVLRDILKARPTLTKSDFARLLGLSPAYVSELMRGTRGPLTGSLLLKMAAELDLQDHEYVAYYAAAATEKVGPPPTSWAP